MISFEDSPEAALQTEFIFMQPAQTMRIAKMCQDGAPATL